VTARADGNVRFAPEESRERALAERVARLATSSADGRPHLVPVTFADCGTQIVIGIDEKPKTTQNLKRLRNIRSDPRVAMLWDRYDEDWSRLWWVRADAVASITDHGRLWEEAWEALDLRYPQYNRGARLGPIIALEVTRWSGWAHG